MPGERLAPLLNEGGGEVEAEGAIRPGRPPHVPDDATRGIGLPHESARLWTLVAGLTVGDILRLGRPREMPATPNAPPLPEEVGGSAIRGRAVPLLRAGSGGWLPVTLAVPTPILFHTDDEVCPCLTRDTGTPRIDGSGTIGTVAHWLRAHNTDFISFQSTPSYASSYPASSWYRDTSWRSSTRRRRWSCRSCMDSGSPSWRRRSPSLSSPSSSTSYSRSGSSSS